jgi:RNA polymerase sigma-70 factor (ECF subfamily)
VPEDVAVQREQRAELRACMANLSEVQRRVLVMKDVLSLSYEQIAEAMDMPVGTVKCHAHRGRLRMRDAMAPGLAAAGL